MSDEPMSAEAAVEALRAAPELPPEPEPPEPGAVSAVERGIEAEGDEVDPDIQVQGPGAPLMAYGTVYMPLKVGFEFEALTMDMQLVFRPDGVCCIVLTAYTPNGLKAYWLTADMAEKLSQQLHNNAVTAKLRSGAPPSQLIVPGQPVPGQPGVPNRAARRSRRGRPR